MPLIDIELTPAEWLAGRLPRRFDEYASDPGTGRWHTIHDLIGDDAALLRSWHARLVAGGQVTTAAAATYLAGWLGGSLAGAIGHALATVDAGFVVDDTLRWHRHPDGWIDRVELGRPLVAVTTDHPWHGHAGVIAAAADAVGRLAVERLIEVLAPVIDACRDLGRTGRAGLWNEVADGLGLSVAHVRDVPVRTDVLDTLARAVRTPAAPWRARPTLRIVEAAGGLVYVGQKGGCCLAYTCPDAGGAEDELDDDHRAYRTRFPDRPGEPRYCATCRFRNPSDSVRRQLFWIDRERPT